MTGKQKTILAAGLTLGVMTIPILLFLNTHTPSPTPTPPPTAAELAQDLTNTARLKNGQLQYDIRCMDCHGTLGKGTYKAPPLIAPKWTATPESLTAITTIIREGRPDRGMPAWGNKLQPKDMEDIALFLLWVNKNPAPK